MQRQFAQKTATLIANTQSIVQWGAAEFSSTLGQDQAVPNFPFSVSFQIANNTPQVLYVGVSYQTRYNSYNLADRRAIAAIPANSTLNITPPSVPGLASIGPDVTDITMTLISAAAGDVTVLLIVDEPQSTNAGGTQSFFGLDQRSILDYTLIPLRVSNSIAGGGNISTGYTVNANKRLFVTGFFVRLECTPFQDNDLVAVISVDGVTIYQFSSSMRNDVVVTYSQEIWILDAGQTISISITSINPSISVSHAGEIALTCKETF